jgi:acetyl-CoA carboxylase biotin carboxyl carrier protein
MKTKIKIRGKVYQVEISEIKKDLIKVRVDDKIYFFTKNKFGELIPADTRTKDFGVLVEEAEVLWETLAEKEIRSPIAGIISSIDVKKDQALKPGQRVATLIAMKMENEIISEISGIVKEIKVRENQFVDTGEVLVLLK